VGRDAILLEDALAGRLDPATRAAILARQLPDGRRICDIPYSELWTEDSISELEAVVAEQAEARRPENAAWRARQRQAYRRRRRAGYYDKAFARRRRTGWLAASRARQPPAAIRPPARPVGRERRPRAAATRS